jgi:hypothetical protein
MSETIPQELVLCELDVALGWRGPDAGLVHHCPRLAVRGQGLPKKLAARGITVSMSRKGDWERQRADGIGQRHTEGGVRA